MDTNASFNIFYNILKHTWNRYSYPATPAEATFR